MRHQRTEYPVKLDGLAAARRFFSDCIADSDQSRESLWVAHLDDKARCLHLSRHPGDESGTDFPIRRILADALAHGSSGIVLAHNHPSGDPRPSEGDRRATRRLACAAEALDCTVVDHLVFAGDDCTSFLGERWLAAAAGMFCGTCSVLLVCLLMWGDWSRAEEHTIVIIFGGALGGFIIAMTSVIIGLLLGGPVGRFKGSASRDGISLEADGDPQ